GAAGEARTAQGYDVDAARKTGEDHDGDAADAAGPAGGAGGAEVTGAAVDGTAPGDEPSAGTEKAEAAEAVEAQADDGDAAGTAQEARDDQGGEPGGDAPTDPAPDTDPHPAPDAGPRLAPDAGPGPAPEADPESPDAPPAAVAREGWFGWRSRWPRASRGVTVGTTVLAGALVLFALLVPNRVEQLTPEAFLRIPAEGILLAALLLVLPPRPRRITAVVTGVLL